MSKGYEGIRGLGKYKVNENRKGWKDLSTRYVFINRFENGSEKKNPIKVKDNNTIINDINNQIKELW